MNKQWGKQANNTGTNLYITLVTQNIKEGDRENTNLVESKF